MTPKKITYEEWLERFKPEKNNIVEEGREYDGLMFETFGPELEYVRQQPANRVWTLLDEDGHTWITNGTHFVNRMGYFVATIPYVGEEDIEITIDEPRYFADQIIGSGWIVKDREATGCDIVCSIPHGLTHGAEIADVIACALNSDGAELDLAHEDDEE